MIVTLLFSIEYKSVFAVKDVSFSFVEYALKRIAVSLN